MNRKELYTKVKEFNLQKEIEHLYGDNYTRISNAEIEEVVNKHIKVENSSCATKTTYDKFDKLIEVLGKKHILLKSEVIYINS